MNDSQRFFAVGATFLAAVAGLALSIGYLRGSLAAARTTDFSLRFADAKGVQTGYQVRMAGIPIGTVQDIQLVDRKAVLKVRVDDRYPVPTDSTFTIITPLIGSSPYIQVTPGVNSAKVKEGDLRDGIEGPSLDQLMGKAGNVVGRVDDILADPQVASDMKRTLHNLRVASEELPRTLRQAQGIIQNASTLSQQTTKLVPRIQSEIVALSGQTQALLGDFRHAAQTGNKVVVQAEGLTADIRSTLNENRTGLKHLVANANEMVSGLTGLTEEVKSALLDPKLKSNLIASSDNITAVTARFVAIAEKLDATAADLEKLAGDPAVADDLKATLANVRATSESARNLAARLEGIRLPGDRRPSTGTPPGPRPPVKPLIEPGLTFDSRYDTTAERLRNDVHFVLPSGSKGGFYRLGLFDATEGDRLDFQAGAPLDGASVLRYGLFAGKLGFGLDRTFGGLDFRLDLYDPNRFTADARIKTRLNATTALTFGVDSVGKGNHPVVGIQIKR